MENSNKQFVVETNGYKESFASLQDAEKQYDILRRRSIKKDEDISVSLSEIDTTTGKKRILKSLKLKEGFND